MAGRFTLDAIFGAKDYASKVMDKIQQRFARMNKGMGAGLKDFGAINDKILGKMNGLAKAAVVAGAAIGGISVAGGIVNVAKTASDYEQAITNVGAVSLMTRDQIADLEAKSMDLAKTTKFTATEVAGAMELMGKAGFTNAKIIQGIDGILSAAAAEGISIEETAGHVSNVLKGMGLDNEDMAKNTTRVADVLALASARTNSSISSLGESMSNVSSTAKQLNVPLEQVVAGVAMLQDVGLDASVAGSSLNTMLTQMAAPSKTAAAEMKKWGVSFEDAYGNMLPFQDVLANLSKAAAKSGGNFDQVAFFADLVGLRGQKAAANLKDLFNSGKYQSLAKELEGAAGSAKKMADIRLNTLEGDVTLFKSSLDLVKIAAFETAGKGLRPLVQHWTEWLNTNKDFVASKATEYLVRFGNSLPTIAIWAGRIGRGVATFYSLSLGIKAVNLAMALASVNPWVIGLYAAIAAVTLLVAFWPDIKRFWDNHAIAIGAALNIIGLLTVALYGSRIATIAVATAQGIAAGAMGAYRFAMVATTAIHAAYTAATAGAAIGTGVFAGSLGAALVTIGAVAAALGALVLLFQQVQALSSETEGLGITGTISEMAKRGTWNPFEAVDAYQNERARARSNGEGAPQVVSPAQGAASYYSETNTNNSAELTIRDQSGRGYFSKPPKGPVGMRLAPSGSP